MIEIGQQLVYLGGIIAIAGFVLMLAGKVMP